MYYITHLLSTPEKISVFKSDKELIDFTKIILKENEDEDFSIISISDAIEYIEDYCDNLTITENSALDNFISSVDLPQD